MEDGQFDNLPGKGKPLDLSTNPHADPAEDTLYRILSRNKCAPEWVELNKDIRNQIGQWRSALNKAWACKVNGDDSKWMEFSDALKLQLHGINNKVRCDRNALFWLRMFIQLGCSNVLIIISPRVN